MADLKSLALQSGEHSDIHVMQKMSGEIHCQTGRARVINRRLGIGWLMREGDRCLLRSDTRYRITAVTPARLSIMPKRVS